MKKLRQDAVLARTKECAVRAHQKQHDQQSAIAEVSVREEAEHSKQHDANFGEFAGDDHCPFAVTVRQIAGKARKEHEWQREDHRCQALFIGPTDRGGANGNRESQHKLLEQVVVEGAEKLCRGHAPEGAVAKQRRVLRANVVGFGEQLRCDLGRLVGSNHYALAGSIATSSPCCAILRMSSVIFIEQYLGPHMLQKWADLKVSCGSVSSWNARAVSGSSERRNCSFQSKAKRARLSASSRSWAPLRLRATSAAWAAIL